jgi:hypothetical protein
MIFDKTFTIFSTANSKILDFYAEKRRHDTQPKDYGHNKKNALSSIMTLSINAVMLKVAYAECRKKVLNAVCHYAECRYAECLKVGCRGAEKKNL